MTVALAALAGGCGDASKHATDGDTGAAAPATVRDMSATPQAGDSTAGVANATGRPASAGDTMGARARDSSPGARGGSPVGGGTSGRAAGAGAAGAGTRP
jgi:hypothetical protein